MQNQGGNSYYKGPSRVLFPDVNAAQSLQAMMERGMVWEDRGIPIHIPGICGILFISTHPTVPNGTLNTLVQVRDARTLQTSRHVTKVAREENALLLAVG